MHLWRTLLVTLVAFLALATPASAHVRLVASNPEPGQELAQPPQSIRLTFDGPLKAAPVITLADPTGAEWPVGRPSMDGQAVTAAVDPRRAPAGEYVVKYQATGGDGHVVSGEVRFGITITISVSPPAVADPRATGAIAAGTVAPLPPAVVYRTESGVSAWIWVVAAAVVVAGFALWWRRHKRAL
jgi:methionine-rich copper-binding protein CopC